MLKSYDVTSYSLTSWNIVLIEKLILLPVVKKFSDLMQSICSLVCSHEPNLCPYTEPNEHIPLPSYTFKIH